MGRRVLLAAALVVAAASSDAAAQVRKGGGGGGDHAGSTGENTGGEHSGRLDPRKGAENREPGKTGKPGGKAESGEHGDAGAQNLATRKSGADGSKPGKPGRERNFESTGGKEPGKETGKDTLGDAARKLGHTRATGENARAGGEAVERVPEHETPQERDGREAWEKLEAEKSYGGQFNRREFIARYAEGLRYERGHWVRPDGAKARDPKVFNEHDTAGAVYEHLAGEHSTSTFKPFAEMLARKGIEIADRKAIEGEITRIRNGGANNEDVIRHELKVAYREQLFKKINEQPTPEARFEMMRKITVGLDSTDKGNITEVWYRENILGGDGQAHVAAKKDSLKAQGIDLETGDRVIDIVHPAVVSEGKQPVYIAHELKSGEGKLSAVEQAQMRDYVKMVDGQAVVPTKSGDVTIKHVRYTFTSPEGGKANADTMETMLAGQTTAGRISFEVFTPRGERILIRTEQERQQWLGK